MQIYMVVSHRTQWTGTEVRIGFVLASSEEDARHQTENMRDDEKERISVAPAGKFLEIGEIPE